MNELTTHRRPRSYTPPVIKRDVVSANILRPDRPTPPEMSPAAYNSMVRRNGITPENLQVFAESIERGKVLIAAAKVQIEKNGRALK